MNTISPSAAATATYQCFESHIFMLFKPSAEKNIDLRLARGLAGFICEIKIPEINRKAIGASIRNGVKDVIAISGRH